MLMDMNNQLSRLITISMDKISFETEGYAGPGKKAHDMDLRKALLVAHFLEQIQSCTNYDKELITELRTGDGDKSFAYQHDSCYKTQSEDHETAYKDKQLALSKRTAVDQTSSLPSATVLQCVITNSDSMVSKYCQFTMPVVCSVNTYQVMSCRVYKNQPSTKSSIIKAITEDICDNKDEDHEISDVKIDVEETFSCDELEVSSCCEVVTTPTPKKSDMKSLSPVLKRVSEQKECPLPKKKRPLPREFLEPDKSIDSKTHNKASTVALESRTSTSVTTVESTKPKVLVQVTDSSNYARLHSVDHLISEQSWSGQHLLVKSLFL